MNVTATDVWEIAKQSARDFSEDKCPRMAAALSYYTIFSLPPLLVLIITLVAFVFDPDDIRGEIATQIEAVMGPQGAEQIQTMMAEASKPGRGATASIVGVLMLLFGATAVVIQLQDALNKAWEVQPDPEQGGVKSFVMKRILSFAMILGIAFLLLVSLVVSTVISTMGATIGQAMGGGYWDKVLHIVNLVVSFGIIAALFAAMYKFLPDAEVEWRDVWVGAAVTSLLFVLGKFVIGLYLGNKDLGASYGAAGSLALILLWVYYSGLIFFLGAEFTQVWAKWHGHQIAPSRGAVHVVEETRRVSGEGELQV